MPCERFLIDGRRRRRRRGALALLGLPPGLLLVLEPLARGEVRLALAQQLLLALGGGLAAAGAPPFFGRGGLGLLLARAPRRGRRRRAGRRRPLRRRPPLQGRAPRVARRRRVEALASF